MRFAAAPEYHVFPTRERPLKPYEAVVRATGETRRAGARRCDPDVVVADILTLAPALAGELEGVPVATLIPHVDPRTDRDWPPYSLGRAAAAHAVGRRLWGFAARVIGRGTRAGAHRARRDAPPARAAAARARARRHLARRWPSSRRSRSSSTRARCPRPRRTSSARCCGSPRSATSSCPRGDAPLVLVAPSTAQDPAARAAAGGARRALADLPVRVLATWNRPAARPPPVDVPPNTQLVEWVSYSRTMPHCDVVVCHGGHGTVVRALACGCVVVVVPAAGDMNENAARVDWAGVGVRIPRRLFGPRAVRLAVERALSDERMRVRATAIAAWSRTHDAAGRAADLVEALAVRQAN